MFNAFRIWRVCIINCHLWFEIYFSNGFYLFVERHAECLNFLFGALYIILLQLDVAMGAHIVIFRTIKHCRS